MLLLIYKIFKVAQTKQRNWKKQQRNNQKQKLNQLKKYFNSQYQDSFYPINSKIIKRLLITGMRVRNGIVKLVHLFRTDLIMKISEKKKNKKQNKNILGQLTKSENFMMKWMVMKIYIVMQNSINKLNKN